jgi:DNA-binding transcriptional MocR family regulator
MTVCPLVAAIGRAGRATLLQIADALQAAVADGSLKPGDRLPPQRQLAAQLDVDLTTVTRAYDEARRRHLLEGAAPEAPMSRRVELTSSST